MNRALLWGMALAFVTGVFCVPTVSAATPAGPSRLALACRSAGGQVIETALNSNPAVVDISAPSSAIWQIVERGVELSVRASFSPQGEEVGLGTYRLGTLFGEVGGAETLEIRSVAATSVDRIGTLRLHCNPDRGLRATMHCLQSLRTSTESNPNSPVAARDLLCQASEAHLRASAAFRAGQMDDAHAYYRQAVSLWTQQADDARVGAALLGLAETKTRQGAHTEVLEIALHAEQMARSGGVHYFALRARAQRCLALRNLGRYQQAEECADPLPESYLALGEVSEAANALYTIAAMAREDGQQVRAREALARALELPEAAITDLVAGRLSQIGAGLAADSGSINSALSLLDDALDRFHRAGAPIWIGGAYLAAARLHVALGANAEASALVGKAEQQFRIAQSPERLASSLLLRARVESAQGSTAEALSRVDEALVLYGKGSRPQLRLNAALLGLSIESSPERLSQVQALSSPEVQLPSRAQFDLGLGLAAYALAKGDANDAVRQLHLVAKLAPDLERKVKLELMLAQAYTRLGRPLRARVRLDQTISVLLAMARDAGSPALRQIAGRRLLELRAGWLDTLAVTELNQAKAISDALAMIVETQPSSLLASKVRPTMLAGEGDLLLADSLQMRLASSLLAHPDDDSDNLVEIQRLLWARYEDEREWEAQELVWSIGRITALQTALGPGEIVWVLGMAETKSVAILIDSDQLSLHAVAAASSVRDMAGRLTTLASDRNSSVFEIETVSVALSQALMPSVEGPPPSRLWIVADETLTAVPFGLLYWHGSDAPLAETSRISVGPIIAEATRPDVRRSEWDIRVLAAPWTSGAGDALPLLASIDQEIDSLFQAVPDATPTRLALEIDSFRQSLMAPGAWVHVAGHGRSRGGLQGHSGLWVDPESSSEAPSFISWLDVVGDPLQAQLLVLNACDLAATGAGPINRASSFAVALHAAGVDDVVAALWPVSDSAAALWVPAFYGELARQRKEGLYDPAGALAIAQQRLRASRMFRHPFHWASMVHVAGPRSH